MENQSAERICDGCAGAKTVRDMSDLGVRSSDACIKCSRGVERLFPITPKQPATSSSSTDTLNERGLTNSSRDRCG